MAALKYSYLMGPSAKAGRHTDHSHGCGCPWARTSAHAWPRTAAACGSKRGTFVTSKLPICQVHNRELHRSGNEIAWWRRLNIDPLSVALKLWQQSRADGELFQSIGGLALRCPLPPGDRRQEAQKREDLAQLGAALKEAKPIRFKENIAMVLTYFDQLLGISVLGL